MVATSTQTPAVGDPVFFEGLPHRITAFAADKVEFASELQHQGPNGTGPRFRTIANLADLRWSSRYAVWYLWGRLLSKSRGGVGLEQRTIVAELRDRKLLGMRATRKEGQGPTGGEQLGMYYCLFSKSSINWQQEIANVRRGDGLSTAASAACGEFDVDRKCKFGYASPEDGDPVGTKGDN